MGKKLTEEFVRQLTEEIEDIQNDQNLDPKIKKAAKSLRLFAEDFYSEVESLRFLEKMVTALIIIGSILLASIKL